MIYIAYNLMFIQKKASNTNAIYGALITLFVGLSIKSKISSKERLFALVIVAILTVLLVMYGIYKYS